LSVALCASSGSPSWWKLHPPAEDFLAFSMDVILVTLELIHLEFLGWNAVPKNGPVSCEMGLNYDQTNAKLTFRMQFRGYILYSCFRVSVSPARWSIHRSTNDKRESPKVISHQPNRSCAGQLGGEPTLHLKLLATWYATDTWLETNMLTPGYYLSKMRHILGFTLDFSGVWGLWIWTGYGKISLLSATSPCFWGFLWHKPHTDLDVLYILWVCFGWTYRLPNATVHYHITH
jgi:hypothetical protein